MSQDTPIESLPHTSTITFRRFASLGIKTYWDLINYFPTRHEDYSLKSLIHRLQEGEIVTIEGIIMDAKQLYLRRGLKIQKFLIEDTTGKIEVSWYNQPFLLTMLKRGTKVSVAGQVKRFGKTLTLEPRAYEIVDGKREALHTGRLVPIYGEKRGLSSRTIREKVYLALESVKENLEFLPENIVSLQKLLSENDAYREIHFPVSQNILNEAHSRLSFDEIFLLQLSSFLVKQNWEKEHVVHPFKVESFLGKTERIIKKLPFELTSSQKKALDEIFVDLSKSKPMNRFLQGDVGSGKTVVAAVSAYLAYLNGFQSLIMAPTEILANQHYISLSTLFNSPDDPTVSLLTGSSKGKASKRQNAHIVVGTQALIQKKISFGKIGLVVVDEQHRFGVSQRSLLKLKGKHPHLLTMTATPIPRTVALTLYGQLDISTLDEVPSGRVPIKTFVVPPEKREAAYRWIQEKIQKEKIQVFIVCPLIEESDHETTQSAKAAKTEFEKLKKIFPTLSIALMHGKLKGEEKKKVMSDFKSKKFDILVATSVVEVGIDVPNATIMLIEGAERYGLSQLHQLRGRVGRGTKESYCLIFVGNQSKKSPRLSYFATHTSGIKLAEFDFKNRGPGEVFGLRQHGIPELKIASFHNVDLIQKVQQTVEQFASSGNSSKNKMLADRLRAYQPEFIAKD